MRSCRWSFADGHRQFLRLVPAQDEHRTLLTRFRPAKPILQTSRIAHRFVLGC